MRALKMNAVADPAISQPWPLARQRALSSGHLHFVTAGDLQGLNDELAKGRLPPDLEAKLTRLALGSLSHRFIEQKCRTLIALLLASEEGSFREASLVERDRLLRTLAYVRKDDDAVPDYRPDGFTDDQEAVRAVTTELNPLLQAFKSWRLRHQVPDMWMGLARRNR